MLTLYSLLISVSGLSQKEAARFHGVRPDTVKSWSAGRNAAPEGALSEIKNLIRLQRRAADEMVKLIKSKKMDEVELGLASDDYEAQQQPLGWPCVSAQAQVFGMVAGMVDIKIKIVPRGSTLGSSLAIEQHE